MRVYSRSHELTCGIDLHVRTMLLCVLDREGRVVLHRDLPCRPEAFLAAIAPFRSHLVVGQECLFAWNWLADLCAEEGIEFVLGRALGMRAIHGLKTKNGKLDSWMIAQLLRNGTSRWLVSTRADFAPRATCCAGGSTSSASAPSS